TNRATGRLLAIARGENPPKGPAPQDKSADTPANVAAVETPQEAPVTKGQLEGAGDAQPGAETGASAADTPGEEAVAGLAVEQPPTDEPNDTASADE
ncbi:MAG: hypothetical protein AAGU78_10175, partial [Chloroflexota bacterium]